MTSMKAKEEVIQTKRITQLGTVREETVSTEEASSPFTKLPRRRVCLNDDSQMRDSIAIPTLSFGASTTDVPKSQEEATSGSDTASLTNDLTESPACDLKAQIEAREERETPFRLALKRAIGSCFNGMMLLDSEIPIYREEACNILWSKYDTVTPSVTPTHQPSVATPLSATHPCISTLIASLPAECEDRPSPLPPSSGTSVTATAEMDAVAASHATTNAPENPQKRKQRKRALWRRNRSKSLIYSIEQNRINYSEIRDTLAALPAKGAEWTGEGEEPTNKEKDTGQPKQRRDTQHWKPPPLIRNVPSKEDLQNIERAYNKLRMEHAQKRPDVQLYESDTESLTLTALIMDEIRRKPACSVQAIREIVWSRGATLRSRHLVWPLILGYLPPDISLWESTLRKKREEYRELIRVWYTSTLDVIRKADEYEKKTGNKMYVDEDLGLLHQIKVDIDRTRPVGFLHMFTHSPIPEMLNRLLITWSKAHPKVGYFQGLNEIPTPLILVFLMPRLKNWENNEDNLSALTEQDYFEVEADAYWCFSAIMDQLTDLYEFLTKHSIPTSHYALRWSLCFMLREFPLRDSVVIWDSLISHPQGGFSSFIQYLAANYILQFSEFIMAMSIESLLFFFNSVPIIWDEDGIKDFIEDSKTLQLAYRQFLIDNTNNLGAGEGEGYEMEDDSETSHTQTGEPTPLDQEFFDYYF